jgi:hypothetical protein
MLKARFIDKILEVMQDEAGKIKIFDNTSLIYFYDDRSEEEKEKIVEVIKCLELKKTVEKYNLSEIVIDYGLKNLRIETKNGKVIIKNLGKYGVTGIWTMVMEILEAKNVEV